MGKGSPSLSAQLSVGDLGLGLGTKKTTQQAVLWLEPQLYWGAHTGLSTYTCAGG